MNLESYIESGVLEAYVRGFLSDTENKEVDAMAEKYPKVKEEIDRIQATLKSYAHNHEGPNKPPSLDSIALRLQKRKGLFIIKMPFLEPG